MITTRQTNCSPDVLKVSLPSVHPDERTQLLPGSHSAKYTIGLSGSVTGDMFICPKHCK